MDMMGRVERAALRARNGSTSTTRRLLLLEEFISASRWNVGHASGKVPLDKDFGRHEKKRFSVVSASIGLSFLRVMEGAQRQHRLGGLPAPKNRGACNRRIGLIALRLGWYFHEIQRGNCQ